MKWNKADETLPPPGKIVICIITDTGFGNPPKISPALRTLYEEGEAEWNVGYVAHNTDKVEYWAYITDIPEEFLDDFDFSEHAKGTMR